jgi:hypothetical protein
MSPGFKDIYTLNLKLEKDPIRSVVVGFLSLFFAKLSPSSSPAGLSLVLLSVLYQPARIVSFSAKLYQIIIQLEFKARLA